jgi:hypothetical protein
VFWVISVYYNIRNTLPKSGTFLLGHPVYDDDPKSALPTLSKFRHAALKKPNSAHILKFSLLPQYPNLPFTLPLLHPKAQN